MNLELNGKQFTLRMDVRAMDKAETEFGIKLMELEESVPALSKLLYCCAESGAKFAGIPFKMNIDEWLGLITITDLPLLTDATTALMGGGEKKS